MNDARRIARLRAAILKVLQSAEAAESCGTFKRIRRESPRVDECLDTLWDAIRDDDYATIVGET